MMKADLIEELSRATNLTTKECEAIVRPMIDSMVEALRRGDKIEIRGFGSFHTRQRGPRTGRNPKTGQRPSQARTDAALQPARYPGFEMLRQSLTDQMKHVNAAGDSG